MAERSQPHHLQVHTQPGYNAPKGFQPPKKGPAVSTILVVLTALPVGSTLLALAGITFVGTLVGLAVAVPVFLIFSPVLVPAALGLGLAVTGFITSGALGVTSLTSLSYFFNYLRQCVSQMPERLGQTKKRMQEMAGQAAQKTKELSQTVEKKMQEGQQRT
ncbi:Oleosin [Dillenia turbinata]|uniref:Oleosin n=1 Tax=Dillenia turbinata TaxID=194707 RepID=A0AAN8Z872_9MAGN